MKVNPSGGGPGQCAAGSSLTGKGLIDRKQEYATFALHGGTRNQSVFG